jgi:tetratricopeptide (TPR) repeat protein
MVNVDALTKELGDTKTELASTKRELADTKVAYNKLKRRYETQTEAAVVLITEYKLKIRQQGKAGENMTRQLEDLKRQLADGGANAELISTLRSENELLKKQNAELRERAATTGSDEVKTELLAVQTKMATLQAQLDVLQAKAIPYSEEELALFKKPEVPAATTKKSSGKLPAGGIELVAEAQRLFAAHKLDEAEQKYLQVLKLDPDNVFTLANLATIEIEREDFVAAEKNLQRAMKLDPKDAFTMGVRGNMLLRLSKYDEAFDMLSRASQLDPNSIEILNSLAITLSHKGQRGGAENTLRKILQLDPNYGNAHNNLAVIYITQDPPLTELARWHYQKALSLGVGRNADLEKLLETSPVETKK